MTDFGEIKKYNFLEIEFLEERLHVILSPWNGEYHTVLGIRTYSNGMYFDKVTKNIPLDLIGDFVQSLRVHLANSSFNVIAEIDDADNGEGKTNLIIKLIKSDL